MAYSLTRATSWNLAGYLYLLVASLISTPIILHSLGVTEFAHYSLIVATLVLASSIDLGLSSAVVRELSRQHNQHHHRIWATSHLLFFLTGLVAAVIATIIVINFESPLTFLPLVFFHTLAGHLLSHYLTLPQAHGRFDLFNLKTFIVGTANTLLSAFLAWRGFGIDTLIFGQLVTYLLTILVLARYSYRHFGMFPTQATFDHSHDLLAFGLKNQVGKLVGQLGAQYAKFLLAPVSSLAVSAYSIAQSIVLKLAGSLNQLSTAVYPFSSANPHSKRLHKLYHRLQLGLFFLSLVGAVLYYFFGEAFLTWWLTEPTVVLAVASVLNLLVPAFCLLVLTPLPSVLLDASGKPDITSLFATVTVGLEIVLAIWLLPSWGLLAPPLANLLSLTLTTPVLLIVTERVLARKLQ